MDQVVPELFTSTLSKPPPAPMISAGFGHWSGSAAELLGLQSGPVPAGQMAFEFGGKYPQPAATVAHGVCVGQLDCRITASAFRRPSARLSADSDVRSPPDVLAWVSTIFSSASPNSSIRNRTNIATTMT